MLKDAGSKIRGFFTIKSLCREPLVFSIYAVIACFMTYPAVTLVSRTYAEARDPLGNLWWFWWLRYSFFERIPVTPVNIVGVPSGLDMSPYRTDSLYHFIMRVLSVISSETVAYNIVLLLSFFLTAVFTYYLVKYLTDNIYAAAFSGVVLAFSPYMLTQGKEHLGLIAVFWVPLFFLLLIKAWDRRKLGDMIGCSAVFVLMTLYNYQFGFIVGICALVFSLTLWLTGSPWKRKLAGKKSLLKILPFAAAVVIIATVLFAVFVGSPAGNVRNISEVYKYSARPWDFFIPHAEGRAVGYLTHDFIVRNLHGSFLAENSLFLGYIPLFLSIFAVVTVFTGRRKKKDGSEPDTGTEPSQEQEEDGGYEEENPAEQKNGNTAISSRRLIVSFAVCGLFAILVSMPPTFSVAGVDLYLPSYILHKLIPQFRVYARFGMITIFCVAVLCGYAIFKAGRNEILKKWRVVAITAVSVLVLLEFAIVPPFHSLDTQKTTDYYRWLEAQPGKPVTAVYPLFYVDIFYNYEYFFQQRFHKKPLVNGAAGDSWEETFRWSIMDITNEGTPGLLKFLGTKYVLVIPSLYDAREGLDPNLPFLAEIDLEKIPPGLDLVEEFEDCSVYEVTAPESKLIPLYSQGFYWPYMDPYGKFVHPATNSAEITIESLYEKHAACNIRFSAMCPRAESNITVYLNGTELKTVAVTQTPSELLLTEVTLNPGRNRLELVSDGDLYFLSEVPGAHNMHAAMIIGDITLEKTGE